MTTWVLDASNHDWRRGPMDLAAMVRHGVAAMTHKATDGPRFYRDPYFPAAMARGRAAGMVLGAYHVLWPGNIQAQADWFVSVVTAAAPWWREGPFLWQIDAERFDYFDPPRAPSVAEVNAFGDAVAARTGRVPLAYAPDWLYGSGLAQLRYPLWASNYGTNPAARFTDLYPGDISSRWRVKRGAPPATLLQFGSRATIASQPGCDINAHRGDLAQLLAAAGSAPAPGPAPDRPHRRRTPLMVAIKEGFYDEAAQPPSRVETLITTPCYGQAAWKNVAGYLRLAAAGTAQVRVWSHDGTVWTDHGLRTLTRDGGCASWNLPCKTGTGGKFLVQRVPLDGADAAQLVEATVQIDAYLEEIPAAG